MTKHMSERFLKSHLFKLKISKNKYTQVHKCLSGWQYIILGHKRLHLGVHYLDTYASQNF